MRIKWQRPQVLLIDATGQAFGDCFGGSTAAATSCSDGQNTTDPNGTGLPHGCANGGVAQMGVGCSTGSTVP